MTGNFGSVGLTRSRLWWHWLRSGQKLTLIRNAHFSALRSLGQFDVAKDRLPPRADSVMARRMLLSSALRGTQAFGNPVLAALT
jgi:hypothetical protein